MGEKGKEFNEYIELACKYAMLEYDLGLEKPAALFFLDQNMIDTLGSCWISCVSIPDAAHIIATTIQFDSK